jgi:hypothetical protein
MVGEVAEATKKRKFGTKVCRKNQLKIVYFQNVRSAIALVCFG